MESDEIVCEHVSRQARYELVELLLGKLGSATAVAALAGVTEMAVRKWLIGTTHPSNVTLRKLLGRAFELDVKQTSEILERDLEEFSQSLRANLHQKLQGPADQTAVLELKV